MGDIENATQFAPGHLAEHKVSLVPIRVTYVQDAGRSGGGPARGRALATRASQPASTALIAASSSSGENTSSNDELTLPSAPTTKTYGSDESLNAVVASTGDELVVRIQHGLERATVLLELVRLDVDEGHVRVGRRDRLQLVERGPAGLGWQNFGVAKMRTNGFFAASASASEVS